jgi:molybdenum cofactor biosynthesis enzyme
MSLDNYPKLPNAGTKHEDHFLAWMMALVAASVAMVAFLSWRMCRYIYNDIFIAFISFVVSCGVRIQNLYRRLT